MLYGQWCGIWPNLLGNNQTIDLPILSSHAISRGNMDTCTTRQNHWHKPIYQVGCDLFVRFITIRNQEMALSKRRDIENKCRKHSKDHKLEEWVKTKRWMLFGIRESLKFHAYPFYLFLLHPTIFLSLFLTRFHIFKSAVRTTDIF